MHAWHLPAARLLGGLSSDLLDSSFSTSPATASMALCWRELECKRCCPTRRFLSPRTASCDCMASAPVFTAGPNHSYNSGAQSLTSPSMNFILSGISDRFSCGTRLRLKPMPQKNEPFSRSYRIPFASWDAWSAAAGRYTTRTVSPCENWVSMLQVEHTRVVEPQTLCQNHNWSVLEACWELFDNTGCQVSLV